MNKTNESVRNPTAPEGVIDWVKTKRELLSARLSAGRFHAQEALDMTMLSRIEAFLTAAPSAPQGGGVDGRAIAQARDAWQNSDEGRMLANDINGPVGGQCLRNRLEVAFCAGYEAALAAQPAACVGCEGKPAPENSPCAVCGQQPAAVDEAMVERALAAYLRRQEDGESLYGCVTAALTAALAGQQQGGA